MSEVPGGEPGVEFPVCCPPFTTFWPGREFSPTDTLHRRTCFVGFREFGGSDSEEQREGRWCGYGCLHCDDTKLDQQFDQLDGKRWLAPVDAPQGRNARGVFQDALSHDNIPVRDYTEFRRGNCWKNAAAGAISGVECFGTDICSCVFENSTTRIAASDGRCSDGTIVGDPLQAFLPDEFFYTGYKFPPATAPPNWIDANGLYCRRFQDARLPGGWDSTVSLGVERLATGFFTESVLMPVFAGDSACERDWFVDCTQRVVTSPSSVCGTSAAQQWIDPPQDYYEPNQQIREQFDPLVIQSNTAHIRNSTDAMGDRDDATIDFKNKVLEFIKTQGFPVGVFDLRFNELDYQWEQHIGLYHRNWFETSGTPLEIPNIFGVCHLAKTGCPVEVHAHIAVASFLVRLMFHKAVQHNADGTSDQLAIPYAVAHILGELRYQAVLPEPCTMLQSWRAPDDPLHEQEITLAADGRGNMIVPQPEGIDWIVFKDPEGRSFHPTPMVEWRGRLGGWTRPTAFGQRHGVLAGVQSCQRLMDNMSGTRIPGIPDSVDSVPDDRAQIYGGEVTIGFGP